MAIVTDINKSTSIFEEKKRYAYEFLFMTPCSVNDFSSDVDKYFKAPSNLLGILENPNMAIPVLRNKPEQLEVYKKYLAFQMEHSDEFLSAVETWIEDEDVSESGMVMVDVGFHCAKIEDKDLPVIVDMVESLYNRVLVDDEPGIEPLKVTEFRATVTKTEWITKFYTVS